MMESPQMYDLSDAVVKPNFTSLTNKSKLGGPYGEGFGDLDDLGASEVSLDLQAFVNDPHFSDGIFPEIVEKQGLLNGTGGRTQNGPASSTCSGITYPTSTLAYLPQPVHCGAQRINASVVPVKKDPDAPEYQPCRQPAPPPGPPHTNGGFPPPPGVYNPAYTSLTPVSAAGGRPLGTTAPARTSSSSGSSTGSSKHASSKRIDRSSEEYRRRRERNNVAVRKSREKAKMRTRETEERVKFLSRENEALHKRIELMTKELNVLKNLFANVGVLPDQLNREIAKHLGDAYASRPPPAATGL